MRFFFHFSPRLRSSDRLFACPSLCLYVYVLLNSLFLCLSLRHSSLSHSVCLCVSLPLPSFLSRSLSSPLSLFSLALSLALSSRSPSPLSLSHFLPSLISLYRSLSLSSVLQPFDILIDQPLYFSLSLLWFYSFLHLFSTCTRRLNRVFHFSRVSILI